MAKFNPNLHIISIKGKKYLPVAPRIMWFRDMYPTGQIMTALVHIDDTRVMYRAEIVVDGILLATAHGSALLNAKSVYAGREPEKAETSAIGRALAIFGFGTMHAGDDLDDTEHLADSPLEPKSAPAPKPTQKTEAQWKLELLTRTAEFFAEQSVQIETLGALGFDWQKLSVDEAVKIVISHVAKESK